MYRPKLVTNSSLTFKDSSFDALIYQAEFHIHRKEIKLISSDLLLLVQRSATAGQNYAINNRTCKICQRVQKAIADQWRTGQKMVDITINVVLLSCRK